MGKKSYYPGSLGLLPLVEYQNHTLKKHLHNLGILLREPKGGQSQKGRGTDTAKCFTLDYNG